jgi:hypothetical protein
MAVDAPYTILQLILLDTVSHSEAEATSRVMKTFVHPYTIQRTKGNCFSLRLGSDWEITM